MTSRPARFMCLVAALLLCTFVAGCSDQGNSTQPEVNVVAATDLYRTAGGGPSTGVGESERASTGGPRSDASRPSDGRNTSATNSGQDVPWTGEGLVPEPYEVFGLTPEQSFLVAQARFASISRCMSMSGFDLEDSAPTPLPVNSFRVYDYTVGLIDSEYATKWGYQYVEDDLFPKTASKRPSMPSGVYEQMFGDCAGEVDKALYANLPTGQDVDAANDVSGNDREEAIVQACADIRMVVVLDEWSKCMATDGYSYASPVAAYEAFDGFDVTMTGMLEGRPEDMPSQRELDVAQRDVECKQATDLVPIWRQVLREKTQELVDQHRPSYDMFTKQNEIVMVNANRILAETD